MGAVSMQTKPAGHGGRGHALAALVGALALTLLPAGPARAQAVCWYSSAQKTPEAALAACDKVIEAKAFPNKGFESAIYLSRAMARFELLQKQRAFTVAGMQAALADLDQSVAAMPQEHAHTLRALLYERMARQVPAERARYRKLAVEEARAAMAFPGTAGDDLYRKIIRENR